MPDTDPPSNSDVDALVTRVRRCLRRFLRERGLGDGGTLARLYNLASESELLEVLGLQPPRDADPVAASLGEFDAAFDDARTAAGEHERDSDPTRQLGAILGLPRAAEDLIALTVAPQLSPKILRVYRALAQDAMARHPSASFLLELCATEGHAPKDVMPWLSQESSLVQLGLIATLCDDAGLSDPPPTSLRVAATGRLHAWFCGDRGCHDAPPGVDLLAPPDLSALVVDPRVAAQLRPLVQRLQDRTSEAQRLIVRGPEGAGRRTMLALLAGGLVTVDVPRLAQTALAAEQALRIARREARLSGRLLAIAGLDSPSAAPANVRAILNELAREKGAACIVVEQSLPPDQLAQLGPQATAVTHFAFPAPDRASQRALWQARLDVVPDAMDLDELVNRYNLVPAKITAAAAEVRADAANPNASGSASLIDAIRRQLSHRLGDLATRVETTFARDALIATPKIDDKLDEIIDFYRNRDALFERWCFDAKMPYGRGLSCLFAGPPGTGKTMAAAVVARELGLEIFKVDLSRIVDKYIGETDKQVARLFDEAARSQAVLLFDEADSLFAQRTEVRNSTDRYANVTVNFLLQRLEAYTGISILTTNLETSIDEAFKRRIRFRVHFDRPDFDERRRLWLRALPPRGMCAADIDVDELADRYELVGADILNASLQAASAAQRKRTRLSRVHLIASIESILSGRGMLVRSQL